MDVSALAAETSGLSGSDLKQLCARAALRALRELLPPAADTKPSTSASASASASADLHPSSSVGESGANDHHLHHLHQSPSEPTASWDVEWRRIADTQAPPSLRALTNADFAGE